jgi:hypothetical protein
MKKRKKRKRTGRVRTNAAGRRVDDHHFWHPKKLYRVNWLMAEIDYLFHHAYHTFMEHNCKNGNNRDCNYGDCQYEVLCCYAHTTINYGKAVPQTN